MRALWRACQLGVLAVALVLAGCGSSEEKEVAKIRFESPAVRADGEIAPSYRCGYGSIWLPLKWGSVPADTAELVIYFGQFEEEGGGSSGVKVPFGILITEIDPSVRSIPTNTLPEGAVPLGYRSSNSCPSERKGQNVVMQLFALDAEHQLAEEGFSSVSLDAESTAELTEAALTNGESNPSSELAKTLTEEALALGRFTATYGPAK
jgi:hypothetical protein